MDGWGAKERTKVKKEERKIERKNGENNVQIKGKQKRTNEWKRKTK